MVDFLADYFGDYAEVVLHDLTNLEQSIIKIRNGHISGRKEGDPCTDFVLRTLKQSSSDMPYAVNYRSTNQAGIPMKSGTFFIRDNKQKIVGMLCVNIDVSFCLPVKNFLDVFLNSSPASVDHNTAPSHENLGIPVEELIDTKVSLALADCGCDSKILSAEEKLQLIKKLNEEGIFLLKGSVGQVAEALGLSVPSVYRYIKKLKKE